VKANPLNYQISSITKIEKFHGRCLLAHEMGLGKTLISLWWWQRHPEAHPALVICPASAKWVWAHEAAQNIGIQPLVIEGTKAKNIGAERTKPDIVIINYDVLHHWVGQLQKFGFCSLFIDECHFTKSTSAKRTKAVRAVAKGIRYVIAISGTPLLQRPIELFPTLQMLRPSVFRSRWAYAHKYCNPRWTPWGWKYDGASRLPELHNLLQHTVMIRYRKQDVMPELPEKVRRVLPLPLSDESEYLEAKDSFLLWLGRRNPTRLRSAERSEALVQLGYLKRLAARLKLRAAVDWVNRWIESYPTEKIVLFAVHRKAIEALQHRIKAKMVTVDGSITGRKRKTAVQQFQQDSRTKVFLGNIRATGTSITLTAATTVAFIELDWVPAVHTQAEDRIHRIGQREKSWIWYLVAAGTIEERLCKILEQKQRVVTSTLDGFGKADELDVYKQLLKQLAEERA